jgi:Rho-binding antiterminator
MTDYTPIDCGLRSEYELVIVRYRLLRLAWCDAQGTPHLGLYRPLDLHTRDGEEFMVVADADGTEAQIRLDHIMRYNPA